MPAACIPARPDNSSPASDQTSRGGYRITEDPQVPVMILTVPLPKNDRAGDCQHLSVSVPPQTLQAGQFYLIGSPGQDSCEIVRVEGQALPGQPRRIRRHLFHTIGPVSHPAGTWVRQVSVERVFDWAQWQEHAQH